MTMKEIQLKQQKPKAMMGSLKDNMFKAIFVAVEIGTDNYTRNTLTSREI